MFPSAAEYVWFQERFPRVAESYCLTYVRGLTPDDVVERLAATSSGECRGVGVLPQMSGQTWEEHNGERLLFGATAVDGWTLAVEVNGWLGVTESLLIP